MRRPAAGSEDAGCGGGGTIDGSTTTCSLHGLRADAAGQGAGSTSGHLPDRAGKSRARAASRSIGLRCAGRRAFPTNQGSAARQPRPAGNRSHGRPWRNRRLSPVCADHLGIDRLWRSSDEELEKLGPSRPQFLPCSPASHLAASLVFRSESGRWWCWRMRISGIPFIHEPT